MTHVKYMQRCIDLALNGRGSASPNPMVGAVVVHNDLIIGEGWHQFAGAPHAEVNAINEVKDESLLADSTIYVSLEPCAHHGRTPPCADLIITKKIPRVVIGCRDPFSEVNGRGIEKLKAAGVEVAEGILESDCLELNRFFFTYHQQKRPYVILKWAQSPDGYMDVDRSVGERGIHWITQPETRVLVHHWRAEVDAILVGKNTILNDNPSLTVRDVEGKDPVRLIIDLNHELSTDHVALSDGKPSFVFTTDGAYADSHSAYVFVDPEKNLIPQILEFCYEKQWLSLFVEGGAQTLNSFIRNGIWDEARQLIGEKPLSNGLKAPVLQASSTQTTSLGCDTLKISKA